MAAHLGAVLSDRDLRRSLVESGLERIRSRHSCAYRVDELLSIVRRLGAAPPAVETEAAE